MISGEAGHIGALTVSSALVGDRAALGGTRHTGRARIYLGRGGGYAMSDDRLVLGSVVVTGGANGIGAAIVARLARAGRHVVAVDTDATGLRAIAGARVSIVAGDVRDEAVLVRVGELAGEHGLSAWVNNAGVEAPGTLHRMPMDDIHRQIDVNLVAVILGCRVALERFSARGPGGVIVNISSVHARAGFGGWAVYDATKGGVEALTRSICAEYGALGIRCNAIAPGAVRTEILLEQARQDPRGADAALADAAALAPLGTIASPAQIAEVAELLITNTAINGEVVTVDGGLLARAGAFRQAIDPRSP